MSETISAVGHTAGPWRIERAEGWRSFISSNIEGSLETRNGGIYVAHALGPDHEANASLFEAALHVPHKCGNPKCPGNINRIKLAAFDDMHAALLAVQDWMESADVIAGSSGPRVLLTGYPKDEVDAALLKVRGGADD